MKISFAVDRMLSGLGRRLRLLGYDVYCPGNVRTHEIVGRANRDGRVFLTRNMHMPGRYPEPLRWSFVSAGNVRDQLLETIHAFGLDAEDAFTRCVECNRVLVNATATEAEGKVHPCVLNRETRFFKCEECGKIYWRGSHVQAWVESLPSKVATTQYPDEPLPV